MSVRKSSVLELLLSLTPVCALFVEEGLFQRSSKDENVPYLLLQHPLLCFAHFCVFTLYFSSHRALLPAGTRKLNWIELN